MAILNNSNAISSGGYDVNNSLRFRRSASSYLSKTPTSNGNRQKWTWSGWVKLGSFVSNSDQVFAEAGDAIGDNYTGIRMNNASKLLYQDGTGPSPYANPCLGTSDMVFRDPSAWYHIVVAVDTTQATSTNRVKIYVNGSQIAMTFTAMYAQNANTQWNSTSYLNNIGKATRTDEYTVYSDHYQAEVNFIDGSQLTPSSFGETDSTTGVWKPKAYTSTYGTNGFYLKFSDIATTSGSNAGLGKDFSGNTNYWTTNNISVTSGTTYDAMTDSPTLTSATVANYATLNPVNQSSNLVTTGGNLNVTSSTTAWYPTSSTIAIPTSGKWYCEFVINAIGNSPFIGIFKVADFNPNSTTVIGYSATSYSFNTYDGNKANNSSSVSYGSSLTNGDILNIAVDMDSGKIWWGKNGTWFASGVPASGTNAAYSGLSGEYYFSASIYSGISVSANFGQRPFAYTPPTGFVRLNTYNLPDSTIKKGSSYMDAILYTGNGANGRAITTGMATDLAWIKKRSGADNHELQDRVRGAAKRLQSNSTAAEVAISAVASFTSTGFTVDGWGTTNENGFTYVAWSWLANGSGSTNTAGSITSTVSANTTAGFSIVTYTGNGSAGATIGHGLGVAPKMFIVKRRSGVASWTTYHASIGNTKAYFLNQADAGDTYVGYFNNTSPTSSVFSVGIDVSVNSSGSTYVAYCWSEIAGFSKFTSYTGNGAADGPFVYCGFRPKFVMVKRTDTTGFGWCMKDSSRSPSNEIIADLFAESSVAEYTTAGQLNTDFLSNGFKLRQTNANQNANGGTYIVIAFAENPFKNANAR